MNLPFVVTRTMVKGAVLAFSWVGVALLAYAVASRETALSRLYVRYVRHLDASFRSLFQREDGRRVALAQAAGAGAIVCAHLAVELPLWWLAVLAVLLGPEVYLFRLRRQRVASLETQVDGFVVAFANSLKTVPSPAAALQATASILQQPTRQEIELVLKEMRVGSTLEQGLVAMSSRVKSRWLDVAFSAVLIGLRVGGNLPVVLERTAATIREMNRLLGVVRTKTSEGRAQLWVLAGFPLGIVFAFSAVQEGYFDPLKDSFVGQIAIFVAAVFWIASLLLARKVLAVDV